MALAELRNISATSYFRSALSRMTGAASFTVSVFLRELGPTSGTQFICGNRSGASGWAFERLADTASGSAHNYTFTIYENGVAATISFSIVGSVGKMMLFHLVYAGGSPGTQTVYVNGIEVATEVTTSNPYTSSVARFSIGYDANAAAGANPDMGFVSFGYVETTYTASQVAENTLAVIKTQEVTSSGLPTGWSAIYSVSRDAGSGIPSTLRNFGTGAITQTLEVLGRTDLSLSSPPSFLGDSALIVSAGTGDVVGPGSSTNTAVALFNGTTGALLMDSTLLYSSGILSSSNAGGFIVRPITSAGGATFSGIGGAGATAGDGGLATLIGGAGGSSGTRAGGAATVRGGAGGSSAGGGGNANILGGVATSGLGGGVFLTAGASGGTAAGAPIQLTAGAGIGSNQNGGSITLTPGAATGSGTPGVISLAGAVTSTGTVTLLSGTAPSAGGTAGSGLLLSNVTNFGIFFGTGAPTLSAAQGSLYMRRDGTTTSDRAYVNTNGTTGWTNFVTAA